MDADWIARADKYFQKNAAQIKKLRNEFGGHVQLAGVEFATKHFSNVIGHVTWNRSSDGWTMALECDFAGHVAAGAVSSQLQDGTDVKAELQKANQVMSEGFIHAQAATVALVHAFLWDKFGQ